MDKTHKTGIENLFQGIASILRMANDIVVRAGDDGTTPIEVHRRSSIGIPGALNGVFGASVRVGPRVAPPRRRPRSEPLADVFDEGDRYVVIAELPGVDATNIQWNVTDGVRLVIRADSCTRKYHKQIVLPGPVNEQSSVSCYTNGVLELRLWKI